MTYSKFPLVSGTPLNIQADLNNNDFWMVFTRPRIFNSFSPCINPLETVPSAPITIGITVTFQFHSFFTSLARSRNLSLISFSSILPCDQPGWLSSQFGKLSFSCWLSLDHVIWPRLNYLFVFQNPREVCEFNSTRQTLGCAYIICSYTQTPISCTMLTK